MKIVINALAYKAESSGIGVMIRELFGLYTRITDEPCRVIVPLNAPEFPGGERTEVIRAPWKYEQGIRRMFFQTFQMGRQYCRDAVLLTTDSKTPFFLPRSCRLVPLVTDLAVFRMPEVYKRSRVLLWRLQYKYVCRRAELFLAISEYTKNEMVKILGIAPEKIQVVPMACSEMMTRVSDEKTLSELKSKYNLPEKYILFVGNNNPRKNLERTIRAFDRMKQTTKLPHHLVIAGEQGWKFDRARSLKEVEYQAEVRFIDFVPDEDMPALYSAADLFVFTTLYEGFGVPVLEAQACGTPVVTSNVSALPEVVGDSAAMVDPYDVESISRAICAVLQDEVLASELVAKGYVNIKRFSWASSAKQLSKIIERDIT